MCVLACGKGEETVTIWPSGRCQGTVNLSGGKNSGGIKGGGGRRGREVEAVKNGPGDGFVERAAEHGEPLLQIQSSGQRMGKVSPLSGSRKGFQEGVHGGPNAAPRFNGARGDTSASGGRVPEEFVVFPVKGSGARCSGSKPDTVGGHRMPYCCIKEKLSGVKRV